MSWFAYTLAERWNYSNVCAHRLRLSPGRIVQGGLGSIPSTMAILKHILGGDRRAGAGRNLQYKCVSIWYYDVRATARLAARMDPLKAELADRSERRSPY